jgi:hypothetical protein
MQDNPKREFCCVSSIPLELRWQNGPKTLVLVIHGGAGTKRVAPKALPNATVRPYVVYPMASTDMWDFGEAQARSPDPKRDLTYCNVIGDITDG